MKNLFYLLIFYFILNISCLRKTEEIINSKIIRINDLPETENLVFKNFFPYQFGVPLKILFTDTNIILVNRNKNSKKICYNYNITDKELISCFIDRGKGPNEALGIFSAGINNNKIWLHDVTKKNILVFSIENDKAEGLGTKIERFNIVDLFHIELVNDSILWGVGNLNSENKVTIGNIHKTDYKEIGNFNYIPQDVPLEIFKEAYSSNIFSKPDGTKIALAYRFTDIIEIFDTKDNQHITLQLKEKFEPNYNKAEAIDGHLFMEKNMKTKKAFIDGVATDAYLYLIYSGAHQNENSWSNGNQIYVFDWEGDLKKIYETDRYINILGISINCKQLFSYDEETGNVIYADI